MEGKATFTLRRADNGRVVREFTEHNIVTEALSRLLAPPAGAIMRQFSWSGYLSTCLPMYKELCGGIMLLGNTLPETADNVMLTPECIPVATAGDAYSGALPMRGSLNLNESFATENGYHFTWDFGTDKANGTIKCAALTSRLFGNTGFSTAEKTGGLVMEPVSKTCTTPYTQFCRAKGQYLGTFRNNTHVYFHQIHSNELAFYCIKGTDPQHIGIADSLSLNEAAAPAETVKVTLPVTYNSTARPYLDNSAGVVYFFSQQYQQGDSYQLDYAAVDLKNFTVSEKHSWNMSKKYTYITAAAVHAGSLFVTYGTSMDSFSSSGEVTKSWGLSNSNDMRFCTLNGVLTLLNGNGYAYSLYNGRWYISYNSPNYGFGSSVDMKPPFYPIFRMAASFYENVNYNMNPYLGIAANYLATVNNLSEPLVKTDQHTLKITYDIIN